MSQQQTFNTGGTPDTPNIEFLEGNDGINVGPDPTTHILDLLGDNAQGVNVTGNAVTYTETITMFDATTLQKGVVLLADNPETIAGANTTKAITPDDLKAKLGAQTSHGLAYGAGQTSAIAWLGEAANGQIPIGSTGNAPVLANITSLNGTITVTNGPGTIDLKTTDRITGTAQTIGAVTADVITFALGAVPATYALEGRVAAFESTAPAGAGFQIFATVRTTGAAAVLVGIPDIVGNTEVSLDSALADVVVVGNTAIIRVTGVVGLTIDWGSDLDYTFRG